MLANPELGVGMMYLPGLESHLEAGLPFLDVVEVEPQTISRETGNGIVLGDATVEMLASLPVPKLVHGVGAPIGGCHISERLLQPFFDAIEVLDPPWASEHLTFNLVELAGQLCFTGFMLPPIQTTDSVAIAVHNIDRVRSGMSVPLAIETPVNYLRPQSFEMTDGSFIAAIAELSECGILLDLHNVWCNEQNGRQTALEAIDEMPKDRIWELHLAAGRQLDGYWVDAHSGLIQEPIWKLAEQIIPCLPNLKAIIFETMPEYMWDEDGSPQAFIEQLDRLRLLWDKRGAEKTGQRGQAREAVESDTQSTITPQEWEAALGSFVMGHDADVAAGGELSSDPGTSIYRRLARSVRLGVITDTLRLSYRLIALTIGDTEATRLFDLYFQQTNPKPIAIDEIRQFASWLKKLDLAVDHVEQVVEFELATLDTQADDLERTIIFSREPLEILRALGAGQLPEASGGAGNFELVVTPG